MVRWLAFDWFTSVHQQAVVLHRVDHGRSQLIRADPLLIADIRAQCGQTISPKHIALLAFSDAEAWLAGRGPLYVKYGPRQLCRWC